MIDAIKTIVDTIEEMQDFEAIIEDYTATRQRLQEEIKSRLKNCEELNKCMNDIEDYCCLCKEEGMLLGLYYGIKIANLINEL